MTLDPVLRAAMAQNKAYICTTYKVRRALIASKEALYYLSERRLIKRRIKTSTSGLGEIEPHNKKMCGR